MNSAQPIMSGAQISRFSCLAVSPWMNESARFTPNTIVPANSTRGAYPLDALGLPGPPAPVSAPGRVEGLQHGRVAPGVEEQAAGEVDAGGRGRVGGPELREGGAQREQAAADRERDRGDEVEQPRTAAHANTFTARAITRPSSASEISDCTVMAILAQGASGIASVGLKAVAFVKPR